MLKILTIEACTDCKHCYDKFSWFWCLKEDREIPNMFNALISAVYAMEYTFVKAKMKEADITISPDVRNLNMLDFYRGKEIIDKGYEAASKKLLRLINHLKKK